MRRTAVGLAVLAGLAAGCGSSGESPTPSPSATPSPLPSTSPSAVASPASSPSPAETTSPSAAALPVCKSPQLRLSLGETEGGAGQFHQPLVLTNRGPDCTLHGYPGVSFLDAGGKQLGSPAEMTPAPVKRVVLRTGGVASAALTYSNAGAFPDSTCRPTESAQVRVYPPGERVALIVPDKVLVCSATGSHQLHIEPVVAGRGAAFS